LAYVYKDYRTRARPWCLSYRGPDGRPRKERTNAPTKELAKRLLAQRLVELTKAEIAGVTVELKPVSFSEFLKEYRTFLNATKMPGTIRGQETHMKLIEPLFGHLQLKQITTGMIQRFLDKRMGEPKMHRALPNRSAEERAAAGLKTLKPSTINRELMCMSAIFREAVKRGYLEKNPCKGIKQLPEQNQIVRYLSDDEERAILGACSDTMRPIVLCALHTGMRREEMLSLKWQEVDLDQRLVRVRFSKSKKSRYIPVNDELLEVLKSVPKWDDCEYVFANPDTRHRWFDIKVAWAFTVRRSKVKNFRFHDLRHTFASRLVQRGVQIQAVQELLGHATLEMTQRYAHLAPGDLRRAVDLLARKITTQPTTQVGGVKGAKVASDATDCASEGNGAPRGIRTHDPLIKNQLLYQLS
jgi:integrase